MAQLVKIEIPFSVCKAGGTSQSLHDFVYNWMLANYKLERDNTTVTLLANQPNINPTFSDLVAVVAGGGYFEGIKLGIRMLVSASNTPVPAGIRGRSYTDGEGQEVIRTWLKWLRAGRVHFLVKEDNSDTIFKGVWSESLLNSDELAIIHSRAYAEVLEWSVFSDLFNSPDYATI